MNFVSLFLVLLYLLGGLGALQKLVEGLLDDAGGRELRVRDADEQRVHDEQQK